MFPSGRIAPPFPCRACCDVHYENRPPPRRAEDKQWREEMLQNIRRVIMPLRGYVDELLRRCGQADGGQNYLNG